MHAAQLERELENLGIDTGAFAARGLRPVEEARRLEVVQRDADGREHRLTPDAAGAWRTMRQAAEGDGITLFVVSAYRSVERQIGIIRRKLDAGKTLEQILIENAPPGYSEHHTGRALDLGTSGEPLLELTFGETAAFAWLHRHAPEFDFLLSYPENNAQGFQYEPWHWCYQAR